MRKLFEAETSDVRIFMIDVLHHDIRPSTRCNMIRIILKLDDDRIRVNYNSIISLIKIENLEPQLLIMLSKELYLSGINVETNLIAMYKEHRKSIYLVCLQYHATLASLDELVQLLETERDILILLMVIKYLVNDDNRAYIYQATNKSILAQMSSNDWWACNRLAHLASEVGLKEFIPVINNHIEVHKEEKDTVKVLREAIRSIKDTEKKRSIGLTRESRYSIHTTYGLQSYNAYLKQREEEFYWALNRCSGEALKSA